MPTIVDSLILTLGVKADDFFKTQRDVADKQKKFKEDVVKHGTEIEGSLKVTTTALSAFGKQLIGLYTLFTGGKEVAQFITDITATDAALGRVAKTTGISADRLAAYQALFEKQGASAGEAIKMFNSLEVSRQQFLTRGTGPFKEIAITLSQLGVAYDAREPIEKIFLRAAAAIQKLAATNPSLAHLYAVQVTGSEAAAQALIEQGKALNDQIEAEKKLIALTPEQVANAQKRLKVWNDLTKAGESLGRSILDWLTPAFIRVDDAFTHLITTFRDKGLLEGFKESWGGIKTIVVETFKFLKAELESFQETAQETFNAVEGYFAGKFKSAFDTIKPIFKQIKDAYVADWDDIKKITSDFISSLPDYATQMLDGFKGMFTSAFDWLKKSFNEIYGKIFGKTPFGEAGSATAAGAGGVGVGGSTGPGTGLTSPGTRTDIQTGARTPGGGTPAAGGADRGGTGSGLTGKNSEKAKYAMNYLVSQGWTREAAASAIGQVLTEDPSFEGGKLGDTARFGTGENAAHGLFQWRAGRFRALKSFAASRGKGWQDVETQLAFFNEETKKRGQGSWRNVKSVEEGNLYGQRFEGYAGGLQHRRASDARKLLESNPAGSPVKSAPTQAPEKPEPEKQSSLGMGYNTAMLGAQPAAAYHNVSSTNTNNSHNQTAETHVGVVNVHTAATDANGIARDIRPALERTARGMQANYSLA